MMGADVYNIFCCGRESFAKNCGEVKPLVIDMEARQGDMAQALMAA
jgi:N-acetylglutamate synthase-like GNAT family acetyltransferase